MSSEVIQPSRLSRQFLSGAAIVGNDPVIKRNDPILKEPSRSVFSSSIEAVANTVDWMIANRGGLAWLIGLVMVPSQFLGPKAARSEEIIAGLAHRGDFTVQRLTLPVNGSNRSVEGIIYYPEGWDRSDSSRCVLYHSPNAITVSGYFKEGRLCGAPGKILKLAQCPIIMYDYRGTGLSSDDGSMLSLSFKPTHETVVVDGETVLKHALAHFGSVRMIGSSLGGGVATVALERHLQANPNDARRVSLINHDSFSTTPKVIMPRWPVVANWMGWALGGLLDAETAMKSLVRRKIPITVLCHDQDPVIPRGARMAELVEKLPRKRNVSVIHSSQLGHANLSSDMLSQLKRI